MRPFCKPKTNPSESKDHPLWPKIVANLFCFLSPHADSVIELDEDMKKVMHAEISKRVHAIPDNVLSNSWVEANISVPDKIRLGDNPYFEVFKKLREESKLV